MAFLFLLLLAPCLLATLGKYNISKIAFWIFLFGLILTFNHHITDAINIQL